jgi:hypothetical protein
MPSATRNPFEKWFLDFLKLLIIYNYKKFLEVQKPFYKKVFGRRRHYLTKNPGFGFFLNIVKKTCIMFLNRFRVSFL